MAVSPISVMENPQDPSLPRLIEEAGDSKDSSSSKHESTYPLHRKPSRTLLYIRNRASAGNLSALCLGFLLLVLSLHRLASLYMTHRRWINAPITYLDRTCPRPSYPTLLDDEDDGATTSSTSSATISSPKICMTTLTDSKSTSLWQRFIRWRNYDGILEMTWQNKFDYAAKHGYHLHDGSRHMDTSRPPAWSKIPAVQHLLNDENSNCDWVLWTDADTVIMNSNHRIHDFLPSDTTKDLLIGSDNGGGYNSGVFLVRNTAWSRRFLEEWWNMVDYVRPPGLSLSGDNYALKALLRDLKDFDRHVLSPPRCTFNSFAQFLTLRESLNVMDDLSNQEWYLNENYYHRGDFIAHTPGYDNKAECLRMLLQEAQ